jgi:hypothetical protein
MKALQKTMHCNMEIQTRSEQCSTGERVLQRNPLLVFMILFCWSHVFKVGGTKTNLAYLWGRMREIGIDVEKVKMDMDDVIVKSLVAAEDSIPFQVG